MREPAEENEVREAGSGRSGDVAFAAFVLAHTRCGDGVIELRLGERRLIEWCTVCAALETFASPPG